MKFGKVAIEELDDLDLNLPEDHPDTRLLLGKQRKSIPRVYAGCAKWGRKEWVGNLYPEGTKDKEFLDHYVQHFNAIELNSTFYGTKKVVAEAWAKKAIEGFKFCPKFFRTISHYKRLKGAEEVTEAFLYIMNSFGENLGPSFLQLPDNFTPSKFVDLENFIKWLPDDIPVAVELRHPGWFTDVTVVGELFDLMQGHKKSLVITDTAGRRDCLHQRLTTNLVFIRFNGYGLHQTDYTRMDQWVERVASWVNSGLEEIYFFAHQENEALTPVTCNYFIQGINRRLGLKVKSPAFIN
jgi:uncharacterized protein YecE (DUF72 family)